MNDIKNYLEYNPVLNCWKLNIDDNTYFYRKRGFIRIHNPILNYNNYFFEWEINLSLFRAIIQDIIYDYEDKRIDNFNVQNQYYNLINSIDDTLKKSFEKIIIEIEI